MPDGRDNPDETIRELSDTVCSRRFVGISIVKLSRMFFQVFGDKPFQKSHIVDDLVLG